MRSIHKQLLFSLLLIPLWFYGPSEAIPAQPETPALAPEVEVLSTDAALHRNQGMLFFGSAPFTGTLIEHYADGATKRATSYVGGKEEGIALGWYPGGTPMEKRQYRDGLKEGMHLSWWADGAVKFIYRFEHDLHEGNAKAWFRGGSLFRDFNYVNGKEAGSQRMWKEDGSIRANYVVNDGRRYGLLGAKPCANPFS